MNSTYHLIEGYLREFYECDDLVDGDCDLVACAIVNAIDGLDDPDQIRSAVKRACQQEAEAGMLAPGGHPW